MKNYKIVTLGCKVNQYETAAVEELLAKEGYEKTEKAADVCIINTCTVTHTSDRKSRQWIARFRRENPDAVVVVMGCYAQVAQEELQARNDVDLIIGTKDKDLLPQLLKEREETGRRSLVRDFSSDTDYTEMEISQAHERTRATLKVQDGCNQFCSYCIIPFARGPVRSRSYGAVKEELQRLAAAGFKEVVLTGIHLASYADKAHRLTDIIALAQQTEGIERIRLSSLEPKIVTESFVTRLLASPKLCDHFHLSLQSGSDTVLARMERKYTTEDYRNSLERLRKAYPQVGLTTDIIAGFPGETDEEWEETLRFVKDCRLSRLHVFTYSPRKGTRAAAMPKQVRPEIKKARNAQMIALGHKLSDAFLQQQIGHTLEVLTEEEKEPGIWTGYAKNYVPVEIAANTGPNVIKAVRIVDTQGEFALGAPVD